jgi:hypothetical protein
MSMVCPIRLESHTATRMSIDSLLTHTIMILTSTIGIDMTKKRSITYLRQGEDPTSLVDLQSQVGCSDLSSITLKDDRGHDRVFVTSMFCSQCGSPIPASESMCPKCGASTQAVNPNEIISEQTNVENKPQITSTIPLTEGETILWHRDSTHGLIHKEVTAEEAVTNKRCLKYDVTDKRVVAQVGIENMPEVVTMNVHRVNDSLGGRDLPDPASAWSPWIASGHLWRP